MIKADKSKMINFLILIQYFIQLNDQYRDGNTFMFVFLERQLCLEFKLQNFLIIPKKSLNWHEPAFLLVKKCLNFFQKLKHRITERYIFVQLN
jgi:hypothetical protein